MSLLFLGNFDFEHDLADPGRSVPVELQRLNAERTAAWCALAADGDAVWSPAGRPEAGFTEHLAAVGLGRLAFVDAVTDEFETVWPWGWSASARRFAEQHALRFAAPSLEVVQQVNARSFSFGLERELGVGLPGSRLLASPDELATAVNELPSEYERWVVKAEFGMSARERFLGSGRRAPDDGANWVRKRTAHGGTVVFEPWVERVEEAGLQFTVRPRPVGPPLLEGVTPLRVDEFGRYRGSRFAIDPDVEGTWADAIHVGMRVATHLAGLGYYGPLGIDACRYRDADGLVRLRPIQDVNARFTMGSLALGLRRLLRTGEHGTWCHVRWGTDPTAWWESLEERLPFGVRAVRTAPCTLGGTAVGHGTLAVIAPTSAALAEAEDACRECRLRD